jgi:hypothetical protein
LELARVVSEAFKFDMGGVSLQLDSFVISKGGEDLA